MRFAEIQPEAEILYNKDVTIRFWENKDEKYVWVYNFSDLEQSVDFTVRNILNNTELMRGLELERVCNNNITVRIAAKDAAVIKIN